jgi:hypothetical protein
MLLSEFTGGLGEHPIEHEVHDKKDTNNCDDPEPLHGSNDKDDGHALRKEDSHCENTLQHEDNEIYENDTRGHKEGCAHHPALNVMLIEWVKTPNTKDLAIRVGVGRIEVTAWEEVVAVEKRIILG